MADVSGTVPERPRPFPSSGRGVPRPSAPEQVETWFVFPALSGRGSGVPDPSGHARVTPTGTAVADRGAVSGTHATVATPSHPVGATRAAPSTTPLTPAAVAARLLPRGAGEGARRAAPIHVMSRGYVIGARSTGPVGASRAWPIRAERRGNDPRFGSRPGRAGRVTHACPLQGTTVVDRVPVGDGQATVGNPPHPRRGDRCVARRSPSHPARSHSPPLSHTARERGPVVRGPIRVTHA